MAPGDGHGAAGLRDYLQVVKRRKWVVVLTIVLLPLAAALYSLHQKPVYQASAQVLLSGQDISSVLTSTPSLNNGEPDATMVATQAQLAEVPAIAQRALAQLHLKTMSPDQFLADCSSSASGTTDILGFTCQGTARALVTRMVNAYSLQYTLYRRQLDTNAIVAARRQVSLKIQQLTAAGQKGSVLNTLEEREQELQTMVDLQTSNATVITSASSAAQVSPRTKRNVALGIVLGILLGVALAFIREALDTRVRTAQEVADRLGLPLLARVPAPSRRLRADNKLIMLADPSSVQAESFRVLRTNLDFATLDRDVRTVMITSAVEQEGKSTTVANLALALARAGQRVILVDLDLRRPYLDKFFDLGGRPGVTEVVLGRASLGDALALVSVAKPGGAAGRSAENGGGITRGQLAVLGSGPIPPDPGEFASSAPLSGVLGQLRKVADIVLVDAPPLLGVGDALVLSARVDAMLLVTRMAAIRRPMLAEVHRLLDAAPCSVLGFVVTGAEAEAGYGSGYGYGYTSHTRSSRPAPLEDLVE